MSTLEDKLKADGWLRAYGRTWRRGNDVKHEGDLRDVYEPPDAMIPCAKHPDNHGFHRRADGCGMCPSETPTAACATRTCASPPGAVRFGRKPTTNGTSTGTPSGTR